MKLGVRILHPRGRRQVSLAESDAETFLRELGNDGEAVWVYLARRFSLGLSL